MNDRNKTILEAAWRVFARYGLSKTTMNDIAREAGVSRQTLYNAYAGKEDVFRAVVRLGAAVTIEAVEAEWATLESLADKIDAFYRLGPVEWFELVQNSPDAAGLLEGFNAVAKEELADAARDWVTLIASAVAPFSERIAEQGLTPEALADFIYAGAKSAKYEAISRDVFLQRLATLRASVLAITGELELAQTA